MGVARVWLPADFSSLAELRSTQLTAGHQEDTVGQAWFANNIAAIVTMETSASLAVLSADCEESQHIQERDTLLKLAHKNNLHGLPERLQGLLLNSIRV